MKAIKLKYMEMKQMKYIVLLLVGSILFSSCDKWLYLEPEDGIITEEYWQSESDLFNGLMGCYGSMLGGGSGAYSVPELMFLWGEMRADFIAPYSGTPNDFYLIYQGDIESKNKLVQWGSFYTTINYCNTVLEKAEGILALDESFSVAEMKQYKAEALTIRALMYFYLTRMYRDVPLILTASQSDLQNYTVPKNSYQEVWAQIETDLLQAEQDIVFSYGTSAQEDKGRMTAYSVYAILADFYLWSEQYEMSEVYADKIINSGKFWLINGDLDWFENLYEAENSRESIFELQFDEDIPNPMYSMCVTNRNYKAHPDIMENFWPTDDLLPHADSADIRSDKGTYRASLNFMIWKFYGKSREATRSNSVQETDFNWMVYRYADILLMKAESMAALIETHNDSIAALKSAEVMGIIQKVRKRANASSLTDEGQPTTRDGLLNFILNERAREFAFEGKRWFDILRFAKRDEYRRLDYLTIMYESFVAQDKLGSLRSKINNKDSHYLPVPETDVLNSNGVLEQNPFYE